MPVLTESALEIAVSFTAERSENPLDGRVILLISADDFAEPRFQIRGGPGSPGPDSFEEVSF